MTRVVLIGLDAASYNLVDPWIQQGALPTLGTLLEKAAHGPLRSTTPPVTSVAWLAMVTGLGPARLGIYDLIGRSDYGYTFVPATFLATPKRTLWDLLGARGRSVAVIGVPSTYPASRVNGLMLSGIDSPTHDHRTWFPPDAPERLAAAGITFPWDVVRTLKTMERRRVVGSHLDEYVEAWARVITAKAAVARWALAEQGVDFCMVVFSATDHIVHHTDDESALRRVYEHVDAAISDILAVVDPTDTWVIVASDHGSTRTEFLVSLYRLLYDHGWLAFREEVAAEHVAWLVDRVFPALAPHTKRIWQNTPITLRRLLSALPVRIDPRLSSAYSNIDWERTSVYAPTPHGPLYVNMQGREPQGMVPPGAAYERLRDEVIDALSQACDPRSGRPLFAWVRRGEEVFPPPHFRPPPDLMFEPADWTYKIVTGFHTHPLVRPNLHRQVGYVEHGWHTPWGVFALVGPGVSPGVLKGLRIVDVAPTVLHLLGEAIPDDVEGNVPAAAFTETWWTAHPVREETVHTAMGEEIEASADEVRAVEEHLRALGYLE